MKTRAGKSTSKTKALKIGGKHTKAKLPQYKAKQSLRRGSRKPNLKTAIMNATGGKIKIAEEGATTGDLSSRRQFVRPRTLKRRKRKNVAKGDVEHFTIISTPSLLESYDDSLESLLSSNRDDKSQRGSDDSDQINIGSPLVVEVRSENLPSLRIPDVFKQDHEDSSNWWNADSENDGTWIATKPLETWDDVKTSLVQKNNRETMKNKKLVKNESCSTNVSSWKTESPSEEFEECVLSPQNSLHTVREDVLSQTGIVCRNDVLPQLEQCPIQFYCLSSKVVAIMQERARFCFMGKLVVSVIYGAVEAYGFVITTEGGSKEIYSPRLHSNVFIETSDKYLESSIKNVWLSLAAEGVYEEEENQLVTDIQQIHPGQAVVLLSRLENNLTKFLDVFYPFRLFASIRCPPYCGWTDCRRAEAILQSNLYIGNHGCRELVIDPSIRGEVAEKMLTQWQAKEWSCALIAGGKGVGKSTSTRYLINSLLPVSKKVVLFDVDPGQTECTPPGCISYSLIEQSLMGPNFTHLKTPVFQVHLGDVNVARCITRYIEGVKMLVEKLTSCPELSRLPIVVNTLGFTQGIGWDIALFIIKSIRPSIVVQIMSRKPKNNHIGYLSKQVVNRQSVPWVSWSKNLADWNASCDHELVVVRSHAEGKSSPGYENWNMAPYQQRELVMISYFSGIFQNPATSLSQLNELSLNITDTVPYVTPFSSVFISVLRASVPPTHILNVLNGNIVALCGVDVENERAVNYESNGLRVLDRAPLCPCYGFGIVRGVDMEREEIFLSTPLPPATMQHVNCLMGCIPVPLTLLQLYQHRNVPYTGGGNVMPMSRDYRRGYFHMRHPKVRNYVSQERGRRNERP